MNLFSELLGILFPVNTSLGQLWQNTLNEGEIGFVLTWGMKWKKNPDISEESQF